MATTQKKHVRSREDISEMPDWLKEKHCPHRDKFMSATEALAYGLIDEVIDKRD